MTRNRYEVTLEAYQHITVEAESEAEARDKATHLATSGFVNWVPIETHRLNRNSE